ncbi:hypothetical protein HRbin17_01300 [bacterium HR17]|uniref:Uncharacterized protein n=1 Tax=Candidatus Fervidibacter japonicus TaxID=2035412 RepID=A0A2H5XC81_9BACT|nr:hypothetical protein HRbin17_01300 [bacterium HR17]
MPLNTDQKRFLAAALMELEEHLLQFERWLQADETVTIFRRVPNPFPSEQRARLKGLIAAVKERLRIMRDTFSLPTETVSLPWSLSVTLLHLATTLEECDPQRLKAFSAIDEGTAETLTRQLNELTQYLAALHRLTQPAAIKDSGQS